MCKVLTSIVMRKYAGSLKAAPQYPNKNVPPPKNFVGNSTYAKDNLAKNEAEHHPDSTGHRLLLGRQNIAAALSQGYSLLLTAQR
ncbi:unnamed protein product [Urochloa humidicola]